MITIAELKKQYPQYQNIADDELAEKFYNKYYKGKISLNDFKNKVLPSSASVTEKKETKAIAPLVEGLDVFGAGEGIGGTPNIDLPPEQLSSIEQYLMSDSFKRLALISNFILWYWVKHSILASLFEVIVISDFLIWFDIISISSIGLIFGALTPVIA